MAKRVEYRPRYFKRGQLTRLCLDYIREHAGQPIMVADILPLAVGERILTQAERAGVSTAVHQALHKIAKRGTIERIARVGRVVRWRVASDFTESVTMPGGA